MHDDTDVDEEFADEPDVDEAAIETSGHTLSIRRANGEEVVRTLPNEEWSVYLQPGAG